MTAVEGGALGLQGSRDGGIAARRAVMHWAWRLFRNEWRQQLLMLALIIVSVAALFVAAAVATNNPTPANVGFGSANDLATFEAPVPHLAAQVAALERRFGRVEVIENETLTIPGTTETYQLRAESSHGPFSGPLLSLLSGRYPSSTGEVALTQSVASGFDLRIGSNWSETGVTRKVVGIVENPLDTLDGFALVVPGQVRSPSDVELLFDAPGVSPASIGPNVEDLSQASSNNAINPETIIAMVAVLGMVLIALVSIGGFTVLAQRRLRSLGLLAANGATTKHVRLVVRTNGAIVGCRRNGHRRRDRTRRVADLPPDDRGDRAPCDRPVPTSLGRDRSLDGTRHRRDVSRRRSPGENRRHGAGA